MYTYIIISSGQKKSAMEKVWKVSKTEGKRDLRKLKIRTVEVERFEFNDLSSPKVKKVVHKVMTKYHDDKFYKQVDLLKLILDKLNVKKSIQALNRVRTLVKRWLKINVENNLPKDVTKNKENIDSKTGMKVLFIDINDTKSNIEKIPTMDENINKEVDKIKEIPVEEKEKTTAIERKVVLTSNQSQNVKSTVESSEVICVQCKNCMKKVCKKEIEPILIDLTEDATESKIKQEVSAAPDSSSLDQEKPNDTVSSQYQMTYPMYWYYPYNAPYYNYDYNQYYNNQNYYYQNNYNPNGYSYPQEYYYSTQPQ